MTGLATPSLLLVNQYNYPKPVRATFPDRFLSNLSLTQEKLEPYL